jgi:hypothetical protein
MISFLFLLTQRKMQGQGMTLLFRTIVVYSVYRFANGNSKPEGEGAFQHPRALYIKYLRDKCQPGRRTEKNFDLSGLLFFVFKKTRGSGMTTFFIIVLIF